LSSKSSVCRFIFVLYIIFLGRRYSITPLSGGGLKKCGREGLKECIKRTIGFSSNIEDIESSGSCIIEDKLICCTGSSGSRCILLSEVCVERSGELFTIVVLSFSITLCVPVF
jgi:hypothetical protein